MLILAIIFIIGTVAYHALVSFNKRQEILREESLEREFEAKNGPAPMDNPYKLERYYRDMDSYVRFNKINNSHA